MVEFFVIIEEVTHKYLSANPIDTLRYHYLKLWADNGAGLAIDSRDMFPISSYLFS